MNSSPVARQLRRSRRTLPALFGLSLLAAGSVALAPAATNVLLWDTLAPVSGSSNLASRVEWKVVPTDLFTLEADPPKARSDPGYSGRDYAFKGDAVVENQRLVALFSSALGRVVFYAKTEAQSGAEPASTGSLGRKFAEFAPLPSSSSSAGGGPSVRLQQCVVVRNACDEVRIDALFSSSGSADVAASFVFGRDEIVAVKPDAKMKEVRLGCPMEFGIVPGFLADDWMVSAGQFPETNRVWLPPENMLVGLLPGEDAMLVMTWPKGEQQVRLDFGAEQEDRRVVDGITFAPAGQSFYLAALTAPGIWHREALQPTHLEKDVESSWQRPFPGKWTTQLSEEDLNTTFAFRTTKGETWRGVPGSYRYPVWFDGETAFFHLSKKVPPKDEAIIYFLEGRDTPLGVRTPFDVLQATLGRPFSEALLDFPGRKLRTHHRRGGDGVHRACTCGCTDAIKFIFEGGQEVTRKTEIEGALGDMNYFVDCHVERIGEYRRFADDLIQFLHARGQKSPELKPFLESLEQIAQQIPQEYTVQKENMKSKAYADDLTRQTLALTSRRSTNNLPAFLDLLKAWRGMGGSQDYVVAQYHRLARRLFQEAAAGCATEPEAVGTALEVRARCRQVLRNPDGYEIWPEL